MARLARFSFNWRDTPPKNLKSSCSSRHRTALWSESQYHPSESLSIPDRPDPSSTEMLSLEPLRRSWDGAKHNPLLDRASPLILAAVLLVTSIRIYLLIPETTGGTDLLGSDIPKSIMLLRGQDPYSTQPWSAPYPPLLLFTVASIIRISSGNLFQNPAAISMIDQNVRVGGIFAGALVSAIIYTVLRHRGHGGLESLIPASLFVTLPAISTAPLYWFRSDIFGYPILALSLLLLTLGHRFTGTTLLAVSAIYKLHPLLAVPPILIWLTRKYGFRQTLPILLTTTTILSIGLILPFEIPGYAQAILGFNLANTGTGTNTFSILNLLYGILPTLGLTTPTLLANQVWITATTTLLSITIGFVWRNAHTISPVQIVLLGLAAWLLPLKMLFTGYIVWAFIPIFMLGRLRTAILLSGLLQTADTMAYWSSFPANSPIPGIGSVYGFFTTSIVYCSITVLAFTSALGARNAGTGVDAITGPKMRIV